jgi:hypothetical protein
MRNASLVLIIIAAMACKAKEKAPPQPRESMGANMSGSMPRKMANCPSAVPGATTRLAMTTDGVDVVVTAPDPKAEAAIRALAEFHAQSDTTGLGLQHTGLRGTPGLAGFCPIIHNGNTVTATTVPHGARVHVAALSPQRVTELQQATSARAARLPGFVGS